jgi:hypothetical protein
MEEVNTGTDNSLQWKSFFFGKRSEEVGNGTGLVSGLCKNSTRIQNEVGKNKL